MVTYNEDPSVEDRSGPNMPLSSFRDLRVWQEAMTLAIDIYRSTTKFPKDELYGLTQQMRRAAVSVPSNIAEGKGHYSNKDSAGFCSMCVALFKNCKHRF